MALQSSGAISIANIATEFGGSQPHALNEYYRNGGLVTSNNTSVPTSGQIDLADFYGAVKEISSFVTTNTTNRNASTIFGSNFTANIPKRLVINSGVEVGASNLSNYAVLVPSGMGGSLIIQNAGTLSGAGGDGSSSGAGGAGGTAVYIASSNVTVINTGTIRGGGGGGGKGADGASHIDSNFSCVGGTGGAGGNGQGYDQSQSNGSAGGSKTAFLTYNPGAGPCAGPSCFYCDDLGIYTDGSAGGNGGTYGNAGSQGGGGGAAGGAAGKYIQLASGISYTLTNSGTLQGNAP